MRNNLKWVVYSQAGDVRNMVANHVRCRGCQTGADYCRSMKPVWQLQASRAYQAVCFEHTLLDDVSVSMLVLGKRVYLQSTCKQMT